MRFAGLSLLVLFVVALALPAQEPTKNDLLFAIEKQLQAVHESAGPSVGCVVVSRSEQYPKPVRASDVPGTLGVFDPVQFLKNNPRAKPLLAVSLDLSRTENIPDHGFACGVVIDEKGLVLTPYHVIEGATKIYVHLPGRVGSYADIHAADARTDLAVLRLSTPPAGLKAIKFADVRLDERGTRRATVTVGKLVVLVANAYASNFPVDKPSASLGSVTNVRHHLTTKGRENLPRLNSYYDFGPFLEHEAKLNTGISGAALLNLDGEMIGLTTTAPILGLGEKTPEYALPITEPVLRMIHVLRRGEEFEGGALGVALDKDSVVISGVLPLGPAAKAGLRRNDTITHVNGAPVTRYEELLGHIGPAIAGTKVTLTVRGVQNRGDIVLTLGKWQHDRPVIASVRPAPVFGLRVDHDSILAQRVGDNAQAILENTVKGIPEGVSVREVANDSPAATAFKKVGDRPERWLITHVNGDTVTTPTEFYAATKGQKAIKLTVIDPTEAMRPQREVSFP